MAQAGQPRIVSADGSITETVYALGAEESLVGVDTTSNYPPEVRSQPRVGYLRALPFEGVLALRPDVLLTTMEAAPDRTLERLKQAGVEVIQLPVARSPQDTMARIREVGRVLGKGPEAGAMAADIQKRIERIGINTQGKPAQVLFLMAAGNHGVMIAGQDTAASALLDALGAGNAMGDMSGYKPANREALLASRPDAIVVAESRPGQFDIAQWPQLAALDAWKQGRYYVGDSMLLLGFGPRLPQAMEEVAGVLTEARPVASASD
ncbi:ABC transporter substrate-binding protein [Marinobacter sp. ANT_B65]|nr:ABC transporter substrate-binding protein [Marinobacter sp. ANT_B65]